MKKKEKEGGDLPPGLGEIPNLESRPKAAMVRLASVGGAIELRFPQKRRGPQKKVLLPPVVRLFNGTKCAVCGITDATHLSVKIKKVTKSVPWFKFQEANPLKGLKPGEILHLMGESGDFIFVRTMSPRTILVRKKRNSSKDKAVYKHVPWQNVSSPIDLRFM